MKIDKNITDAIRQWVEDKEASAEAALPVLAQIKGRPALLAKRLSRTKLSRASGAVIEREMNALYKRHCKGTSAKAATPAPNTAATTANEPAKQQPSKYVAPPLEKVFSAEEFDALPEDIRKKVKDNDRAQEERAKLKYSLEQLETDGQRLKVARQILTLGHEITRSFEAQKYYKAHGIWPDLSLSKEQGGLNEAEVIKALSNARSNRTKAKKALEKAEGTGKEAAAKVKFLECELKVKQLELRKEELESAHEPVQDSKPEEGGK